MSESAEIKIREAEPGDLAAIDAIYNQAIDAAATADLVPLTPEARQAWLSRHDPRTRPVLVAEHHNDVVGWVSLSDYRPGRGALRHTAEISYYVDAHHHRQGIASRLISSAIERCAQCEIRRLFAIVLANNVGSIQLLTGLGFELWGTIPNAAIFDDREFDHVYYGKQLL